MKKNYLFIIALFYITYAPYSAASGQLDTSFGNLGSTLTQVSSLDTLEAIVIQPNDDIIIVGSTQTTDSTLFLARYTPNGALDTTGFNSAGSMPGTQILMIGSRAEGQAVTLQSYDDKIVTTGFAVQSQNDIFVARFNTDGSIDTTFNGVGYNTLTIGDGAVAYALGLQSNGDIIVAGSSVNNESPNFTLARFTTSGMLDSTFGSSGVTTSVLGTNAFIQVIAIVPSGYYQDYIIALGNVDEQITVARYTPSGVLDATFGTAGIFQPVIGTQAIAYDMVLDANDNIVLAGSTIISNVYESLLMRITPLGTFDLTFNGTGYVVTPIAYGSEFYALTIQPYDGYIVASGYGTGALANQISVARYTPAGILDSSFGTGGITLSSIGSFAYAQDVELQSYDGNIIIGGLSDGTFLLQRYTA